MHLEGVQVQAHRAEAEAAHAVALIRDHAEDPGVVFEDTETEARPGAVLQSDEHAVESCEIETLREGGGEHRVAHSPPLQWLGKGSGECLRPMRSPGFRIGRPHRGICRRNLDLG